jgi:hypothetical protein
MEEQPLQLSPASLAPPSASLWCRADSIRLLSWNGPRTSSLAAAGVIHVGIFTKSLSQDLDLPCDRLWAQTPLRQRRAPAGGARGGLVKAQDMVGAKCSGENLQPAQNGREP